MKNYQDIFNNNKISLIAQRKELRRLVYPNWKLANQKANTEKLSHSPEYLAAETTKMIELKHQIKMSCFRMRQAYTRHLSKLKD